MYHIHYCVHVHTGWRYTVSAEFKEYFIDFQDSFGQLFETLRETVQSLVVLNSLKRYFCRQAYKAHKQEGTLVSKVHKQGALDTSSQASLQSVTVMLINSSLQKIGKTA